MGKFKMRKPNPKGNKSPLPQDTRWLEQIYNADKRYDFFNKRMKEQKESGEVEKYQQEVSKGGKGKIPLLPSDSE